MNDVNAVVTSHEVQDGSGLLESELKRSIAHLKYLLSRKLDQRTYVIDYILSFPDPVRTATVGERRKIIADIPNSYYSETITNNWSSRVLIANNTVYWQYQDGLVGSALFRSKTTGVVRKPDIWLREHWFLQNYCADVDADLEPSLRKFLITVGKNCNFLDATGRRQDPPAKPVTRDYNISLTPSAVKIADNRGPDKEDSVVFEYTYTDKLPSPAQDPRTSLQRLVSKAPKGAVHEFPADLKMTSAMELITKEYNQVRVLTIVQAMEVARKYNYLFPRRKTTIRKATTYFGDLTLEIEDSGQSYLIGQVPRAQRFPIESRFVSQRRRFNDYTVEEVVEQRDTGILSVYYTKKDVMIHVSNSKSFRDAKLDNLISSFVPIDNRPK
jgi:hypothetical protein